MKFIYAVCSWICLSGFGILASAEMGMNVKGDEGKQVTVTCIHEWASANRKYFCRDPCKDRDVLVSSYRSSNGRFSLMVFRNGKFQVTITDLKTTDSGIYWCGVDRVGADTFHKINLIVQKAGIHTTGVSPTPLTKPQTSTSRSLTPTPDDITSSSAYAGLVIPSSPRTFFEKAGLLLWIAVGLTVMLVIFGVILYVYKRKKRKSHSSRGSPAADAERGTTLTTETVYEDITDTKQTVYSAVNHHSAANQIEDSLYSNLSIQPSECNDQTEKSNTDTVTYAAINVHKKQRPQTFRSEDTVTYDTVFCS